MSWRCYDGEAGRYPLGLAAKLARDARPKKEDVLELVNGYTKLHETVVRMEAEINALKADNLRLQHENNFMLRLVNERGTKE